MREFVRSFRSPSPKPVPPGYEPVGGLFYARYKYDDFDEAITEFIVMALPPRRVGWYLVQDSVGAIILGYRYHHNQDRWYWYGTTKAFEIVQAHPAIDSFAAIGWEQQARATGFELP